MHLYGQGFATRAEFDTAMVERAGYPMGPFTLLDLVGNDVTLAVVERMWDETRDHRDAPAPLLTQLVAAGRLGRKSGRGFYAYGPRRSDRRAGPRTVRPERAAPPRSRPRSSRRTSTRSCRWSAPGTRLPTTSTPA